MDLHHSFLACAVSSLSHHFRRTQKLVKHEISEVAAEIQALSVGVTSPEACRTTQLFALRSRLEVLRAEVVAGDKAERRSLRAISARLAHLGTFREAFSDQRNNNNVEIDLPAEAAGRHLLSQRLERSIADHMLRCGHFESAAALVEEAAIDVDLVDIGVHERARTVDERLQHGNASAALEWCADHASKLRRIESGIEFDLHRQQFLTLVLEGKPGEAIAYSQAHFGPFTTDRSAEIQQAMTTLAFADPRAEAVPAEFRELFQESRWNDLRLSFADAAAKVSGLPGDGVLSISLQAGFSVLKTSLCARRQIAPTDASAAAEEAANAVPNWGHIAGEGGVIRGGGCNQNNTLCPVCGTEAARRLAVQLPVSHRGLSCLVCSMTGAQMDEHNPPVCLPNGNVYSTKAIEAATSADGLVVCGRTGEVFARTELQTVYVL
jgi:hypothetical protein